MMNIREALPIITVISLIGVAALGIYVINQSTEISTLTDSNDELETSLTDLMGSASKLERDILETNANIASLESQILELENDKMLIEEELEDEKSEKQVLSDEIASKELLMAVLQSELDDAIEVSEDLIKQIESLGIPNDQRHIDPSIMASIDCSQCHSEVIGQALAGESNGYHNTHLNNILLNFDCADCHNSVDILSESTDIGRVVNTGTCALCHNALPTKLWMTFTSNPQQWIQRFPNCVSCHDDWKQSMEEATFVNMDIITNDDCTTCHLDNVREEFLVVRDPVGPINCDVCHV